MATYELLPGQVDTLPIPLAQGGEVRLSGFFYSKHDGSEIDAATTTWPDGAPGGASVDAGGLVDFKRGGLHIKSRDPKTHEVIAVAAGGPAPGCESARVAAPCIVLRTVHQAQSRLLTVGEFSRTLEGKITVEVQVPPMYAPAIAAAKSPWLWGIASVLLAAAVAMLALVVVRRRRRTPAYQLGERLRRIEAKLHSAGPALLAVLKPAIQSARKTIEQGHLDPQSKAGLRVAAALDRVEQHIEATTKDRRAAQEQAAADELLAEMDSAMEAAKEAEMVAGTPR